MKDPFLAVVLIMLMAVGSKILGWCPVHLFTHSIYTYIFIYVSLPLFPKTFLFPNININLYSPSVYIYANRMKVPTLAHIILSYIFVELYSPPQCYTFECAATHICHQPPQFIPSNKQTTNCVLLTYIKPVVSPYICVPPPKWVAAAILLEPCLSVSPVHQCTQVTVRDVANGIDVNWTQLKQNSMLYLGYLYIMYVCRQVGRYIYFQCTKQFSL